MTQGYNLGYSADYFAFGSPGSIIREAASSETMWWKCDVKFFRTTLRLKIWARTELEARAKIERMYQVGVIQNLTLSDNIKSFAAREDCRHPL